MVRFLCWNLKITLWYCLFIVVLVLKSQVKGSVSCTYYIMNIFSGLVIKILLKSQGFILKSLLIGLRLLKDETFSQNFHTEYFCPDQSWHEDSIYKMI